LADPVPTVVVQVGPGAALLGAARRHGLAHLAATITTFATDDGDSDLVAARTAVGELWAHGVAVDLAATRRPGRRRVLAPGYAFQRRRLWIDPPPTTERPAGGTELLQVPVWHQQPPLPPAVTLDGRWVVAGARRDEVAAALRAVGAEAVDPAEADTTELAGAVLVVEHSTEPADARRTILEHGAVAALLHGRAPSTLLQITVEGVRVESTDRPGPATAAARSLPRVIAQESPGTSWRTVDVTGSADLGDVVVAELAELSSGGATGLEVAVRSRSRWLRTLHPWSVPEPGPEPGLDPDGLAVIVGGLGDVGLTIAQHLAQRGMRVVLTSRSETVAQERAHALAQLAAAGHDVTVRQVDAADAGATRDLLAELGPIDLVVHAAGVVATADLRPIRDIGAEQVDGHLHAKAGGALALRAALAALPVEHRPQTVVLMSSAGTLVGGIGTGPYSASNGFLDGLADSGTDPSWVSVVWDAWKVGPLGVDREVNLAFALDAATGMTALDAVLRASRAGSAPPVVAVSTTDLRERITTAGRVVPVAVATSGPELTDVQGVIAALWSDLFGVPVRDAGAEFFALGGHSLLATRMLVALGERFGTELRLRDLLANPTVGGLAELVGSGARAEPSAVLPPAVAPPAEPVDTTTIPMTRVQHAYWVGRSGGYDLGGTACHFYLEYDCQDLDLDRYERAWNSVIARHPLLRAITTAQGRLKVLDRVPHYRIRTVDLTTKGPEQQADRLARMRERVSREPGPSDRWPLVQVQAARLPGGRVRLFLGVDVLICDAASYWVIDRELRHFYEHPGAELPPVTVTFAECVAALERRRGTPEWERAATYWRARTLPAAPTLPVTTAPGRFVRHSARLDRAEWAAVKKSAAAHGLTPTAVLLAAYTDELARWSGDSRFSVTLTLFDRPAGPAGVDGVVGDFTSLLLHEVDLTGADTFAERAARTQRTLFTDLDHREFSALDVLAEASARTGVVASVPVVFTSALGLADVIGGDHDLQWAGEQVAALSQTPQTWLDQQVLEQRGELIVQWDALEPTLPPEQVDRAFDGYLARLRALADPAAWSPATAVPVDDVAITLRDGTRGGPTLFLVHPSGGDVLCYAELSRGLDERVSVVGLTDPGLAGLAAPADLPALAALHVDVLTRRQPTGPYLIGGWSMGGSLGQEMARVLHERGEQVALLLMIDSNDPTHITAVEGDPDAVEAEVLARHLGALEAYVGVDLGTGTATERATFLAATPERRWAEAAARLRAHRLLGARDDLRDRVTVFGRHLRDLAAHRPRPHLDPRTHTLLLRADRRAPRNSGIGMGVDDTPPGRPDLGWTAHLATPPEVHGIDADHYSIVRPPAVAQVAVLLNAALAPHLRRMEPFRAS
jgi:thioesterase domain-containing protein/NAD(P)-dependent dehydrogenase (short-subunit alcohol dehydrogenase family)